MAWQRTALGLAGISALLLHQTGGRLLSAFPGLVGLTVATILLLLTERRYERTVARIVAGRDPGHGRLLLLLAGTVSLLAVMAIWLSVVSG